MSDESVPLNSVVKEKVSGVPEFRSLELENSLSVLDP